VWADWTEPYITLQPSYEAAQLGVFGRMFLNGHIYRCGCGLARDLVRRRVAGVAGRALNVLNDFCLCSVGTGT